MQTLYNVRKDTSSRAVNIEARRIARDMSPYQGVKATMPPLSMRFIYASKLALQPILIDYDHLLRKIEANLRGLRLHRVMPCAR